MKRTHLERIRYLCQAGIVAALYTVLTLLVGAFGLANGAIQLRVSDALCILPVLFPAAIPGLTIGCLISNLLLSALWQDVLFGSLATLIGAIGARLLRRYPYLAPIPTVLSNTLIVPPILVLAYHAEEGLPYLMLTVGLGEILSAYLLGIALLFALRRRGGHFMGKKP